MVPWGRVSESLPTVPRSLRAPQPPKGHEPHPRESGPQGQVPAGRGAPCGPGFTSRPAPSWPLAP